MVEHLVKELSRRLDLEDMKFIHWQKTRELQAQPKYIRFHQWLQEHGARYDSIEYPVCFGQGGHLVGIAARRDIGPEEAYIYIPTKIIINDQKIQQSEVGFIVQRHRDVFYEHLDGEYLRLIFFMAYELSKGERSMWAPYFAITEETDLPCFWSDQDIQELEDELLKAEILDYKEEYEAEFEALHEVASLYPSVIEIDKFTEANFRQAFTVCVTRCFGWSLPSTMVVPFADCANHFIIDNQYELFNSRLHPLTKAPEREALPESKQKYFTQIKMRIDMFKHFTEDDLQSKPVEQREQVQFEGQELDSKFECPYKTKRYIRKLKMREQCLSLSSQQFLQREEYKDKQIWELKYVSTSDEEDNDSDDDDDDEEDNKSNQEDHKEGISDMTLKPADQSQQEALNPLSTDKALDMGGEATPAHKIWKDDMDNEGSHRGDNIPQIAKKLRPAKKKQRVYFSYSYDNQTGEGGSAPQKNVVVRKRVEGRQPENLIDLLVMQKHYMYEQEQRMKLLKDQDDEEWQRMTQEYNSSEEEDDEENYAWYEDGQEGSYFVLCTKYKNVYLRGQQVFHCYGRRTNRFLLLNYGFCLNNNKYNSLSFRVWINFDWQKERHNHQLKQADAEQQEETKAAESDEAEEEGKEDDTNRISKIIRLKRERLSEEIFAYIRANLLNTYKGKNLEYLLVSSPVDAEFEMLVVACTINLLKGLMASRFKTPPEKDRSLLQQPDLPIRKRFAVLHRLNAKEVLQSNINLLEILMRVLARFQDGRLFKQQYMRIVEDFEREEEVMLNRLRLRKYLRELVANQKRVLEVALNEDYVKQVREYFDLKRQEEEQRRKQIEDRKAKRAHRREQEGETAEGEEDEDEYYDEEDEQESHQQQQ